MTSEPGQAQPSGEALASQYVPGDVEGPIYQQWREQNVFTPTGEPGREPYCIVIPPPNVTGSLHMGHAFEHTLMDALVRRKRMLGFDALWLPGMDHAGIATQNVVERELAKEGISRHDLGREAFVERVWRWKEQSGGQILGQMTRLGDGVDWTRERFTMDEGLSRAVLTIFKRLYDDDLIYRAERIINWCPRCHTALSDIEVEYSDDEGELVSIRYGSGEDSVVVATTRVETMLGDTAVAVHPDDERYAHLIGRTVELPLTGRHIPVVADRHVDPEFGTGAVKVTPAHDPNDFEIAQRHDLPAITMMDTSASITVHGPFEGLDRYEARPAITQALREMGRIVSEVRPYLHSVGHCSRCKTTVEPRLSLQWFVKVAPLAKAAGDAVRDGRVAIHPPEMAPRWFAWVDNMHDWCISRQLWWGHRIPVWYGPDGEVRVVGPDEQPPTGPGWTQDEDVLDTWFSSGLWPFSTLGWPDSSEDLQRFYPTAVLVTGYDILFFWVARMMMFGLYAMSDRGPEQSVPFHTVALHGMVRDERGKKMSKSFGNVVDPLDWIDRFGADAVRFTLAKGANPGTDVPIGEEWVQGSRNFMNKLWNATRFALMRGATIALPLPPPEQLSSADRWILARLTQVIAAVDDLYEDFQFARCSDVLFHFAWDEVFDWYIEIAKVQLDLAERAGDRDAAGRTRAVLGHVFDALLRMLHPVVPFVTEQLWRSLTGGATIVTAPWPTVDPNRRDPAAEREMSLLRDIVTEVRRFRAKQGLQPRQKVPAVIVVERGHREAAHATQVLQAHLHVLEVLAGVEELAVAETIPAGWVEIPASGVRVGMDLSGAVDVEAERTRLDKAIGAQRNELDQVRGKLANEAFVAKAPEAVVAKMRTREAAALAEIERLEGLRGALTHG